MDQRSCPLCRKEVTHIDKIQDAIAKARSDRIANLIAEGPFEGANADRVMGYFDQGIDEGRDYLTVLGALCGMVAGMRERANFEQFAQLAPMLLLYPDAVEWAVQEVVEDLADEHPGEIGLFLEFLFEYRLRSERQLADLSHHLLLESLKQKRSDVIQAALQLRFLSDETIYETMVKMFKHFDHWQEQIDLFIASNRCPRKLLKSAIKRLLEERVARSLSDKRLWIEQKLAAFNGAEELLRDLLVQLLTYKEYELLDTLIRVMAAFEKEMDQVFIEALRKVEGEQNSNRMAGAQVRYFNYRDEIYANT